MKTVTVRTPQSDRARLKLPEGAQDLPSTPFAIATLAGITAANLTQKSVPVDDLQDSLGISLVGTALVAAVTGWYLALVCPIWNWDVPGSIQREIGVIVNNAAKTGIVYRGTVADGADSFTTLVRLTSGSTVQPYVINTDGGNSSEILGGTFQLVLVAP